MGAEEACAHSKGLDDREISSSQLEDLERDAVPVIISYESLDDHDADTFTFSWRRLLLFAGASSHLFICIALILAEGPRAAHSGCHRMHVAPMHLFNALTDL